MPAAGRVALRAFGALGEGIGVLAIPQGELHVSDHQSPVPDTPLGIQHLRLCGTGGWGSQIISD